MNIIYDEGFSFGLGAFETISIIDKKPILLDAHLKRLNSALKFFGMTRCPDTDTVLGWIAGEALPPRAVLKIAVSQDNTVKSFRANTYTDADYTRGFSTCLSPVRRNETSPLVFRKTLNYGDNILEKRRARTLGFDEPLFLNSRGELCEGATTNIFVVKNGQIFTPPVTSGLLPGTLRQWVLSGFSVKERILRAGNLRDADEIFVSNALLGIMAVTRFEDRPLSQGPVTTRLQEAYATFCRSHF